MKGTRLTATGGVHSYLVREEGITVSPDYIRRAFNVLGIESKTKHKVRNNPRKLRAPYPNLIFSTWETVDMQAKISGLCQQ